MTKTSIKVVVRTRPTSKLSERIVVHEDQKGITVKRPGEKGGPAGLAVRNGEDGQFRVDRVMHNATQEAVYAETAAEVVTGALRGLNGTVFAYGQTGAGKTFTMTGTPGNYALRGVVPRAISHVFREIQARPESAVTVRVSYLEIYNEGLFDLLSSLPDADPSAELAIVTDPQTGGVMVRGLTTPVAATEEEALNLLFEGDNNRAVSKHTQNKNSSRSHVIFTIHLENRSKVESQERIVRSKINLVDLAGSERIKKTGSEGLLLKEAMFINKSLAFLEQVVQSLASGGGGNNSGGSGGGGGGGGGSQHLGLDGAATAGSNNPSSSSSSSNSHIPFRQSKLTNLLKDSLGGNSRTVMVANVMLEADQVDDTISTLRFATRVMKVTTEPVVNVDTDPSLLLKRYEREVKELKQELAMFDTLNNRTKVTYEPYTEEQRHDLAKEVRAYLAGEIDEIKVINLRHIHEVFRQFKLLYRNAESQAEENLRQRFTLVPSAGGAGSAQVTARGMTPHPSDPAAGVGDVDGRSEGFAVGSAPPSARPEKRTAPPKSAEAAAAKSRSAAALVPAAGKGKGKGKGAAEDTTPREPEPEPAPVVVEPPSRADAFTFFKENDETGQRLGHALLEHKTALREHRRLLKDKTLAANQAKEEIDALKLDLQAKEHSREDDVVDEEEFHAIKRLKDVKKVYKTLFDEITELKRDIDHGQRLVDETREGLLATFEKFYTAQYGASAGVLDVLIDRRPADPQGPGQPKSRAAPKTKGPLDDLDDTERFEIMERERLMRQDPEAVSFWNAQRTSRLHTAQGKSGKAAPVVAARKSRAEASLK